jgi:hypothetical protein
MEAAYGHLVYFTAIWCIFPRFGMLYREKSGNPDADAIVVGFFAIKSVFFGGTEVSTFWRLKQLIS